MEKCGLLSLNFPLYPFLSAALKVIILQRDINCPFCHISISHLHFPIYIFIKPCNSSKSYSELFLFNPSLTSGLVHPFHCVRGFYWKFSFFYHILHRNSCKQTVLTMIKCHILRHLNWVSIHVINFKEASGRFFFHFLEFFEKCIEYIP